MTLYTLRLTSKTISLSQNKQNYEAQSEDKNSEVESERSLRSLAYLMHKSKVEEKRAHQDKSEKIEYLSHSHTETLSGSSTTSIVNKCYEKSWKKDRIQRNNNYDDDLEREDDEM